MKKIKFDPLPHTILYNPSEWILGLNVKGKKTTYLKDKPVDYLQDLKVGNSYFWRIQKALIRRREMIRTSFYWRNQEENKKQATN